VENQGKCTNRYSLNASIIMFSNTSVKTLVKRYYEDKGLLSALRTSNGTAISSNKRIISIG